MVPCSLAGLLSLSSLSRCLVPVCLAWFVAQWCMWKEGCSQFCRASEIHMPQLLFILMRKVEGAILPCSWDTGGGTFILANEWMAIMEQQEPF